MATLVLPSPQAPSRRSRKARKPVSPPQRRRQEPAPSSGKVETFFIYAALVVGTLFFVGLWYMLTFSTLQ